MEKLADRAGAIEIKRNSDHKEFIELANAYIRKKGYAKPINQKRLDMYVRSRSGDLFTIYYEGQLVGGNFFVCDFPERVRLLFSFNDRFRNRGVEKLTGALMRYLHWQVMIDYYKQEGVRLYDMGGVNLDKNSTAYGITKFKLSFGGKIVEEHDYTVICNPYVKGLLTAYRAFTSRRLIQFPLRNRRKARSLP